MSRLKFTPNMSDEEKQAYIDLLTPDNSVSEDYELKPCPFCGSPATGWYCGKGAPRGGWWISIKCTACTASVSGGVSYNERHPFEHYAYEKAVMRWNNRISEKENLQ